MTKRLRHKNRFPGLFLLLSLLLTAGAAQGPPAAAEQEIPATLRHVDTAVFNDYINTMIKSKEPDMRAAVTQEKDITDFKLQDADFDITTGRILIKFTIYYKKTDIIGALRFEVRIGSDGKMGNDGTPKIGAYCLGLEGGLHSKKWLADIVLALAKNAINKRLAGQQFWPDQQTPSKYHVFKNENLAAIINQAFINTPAGKNQFQKISQPFPGGKAEVEFKNLVCNSFNISAGQAEIASGLAALITLDFGGAHNLDNAGTMTAKFDFYIDTKDQGWWVKLSRFKLSLNIVTANINAMVQDIIDQELSSRQILIPIDMPQADQV